MNRYGDSPLGMVESALEFARIAREHDYHELIFSMKASNPKVMIEAYRLLVARLAAEGPDWNYPIHLGVTEAGDGEDGRIKSAIGIGSLLADGIGDTIRVSLTEDSVHEIPVARALAAKVTKPVPLRVPVRVRVSIPVAGASRSSLSKERLAPCPPPYPSTPNPSVQPGTPWKNTTPPTYPTGASRVRLMP
jgi:4-hydroxy-3-methylbut-2-en-1-yl diphosphate synthase IspG/GcpE